MKGHVPGRLLSVAMGGVLCLLPHVVRAELVAFWDFDFSTTQDRLGGRHRYRVEGQPRLTKRDDSGKCLQLGGKDCIVVEQGSQLNGLGRISVAAWIWFESNGNDAKTPYEPIVRKEKSWNLRRDNDTSCIQFICHGIQIDNPFLAVFVTGNSPVGAGQWHHVVGTYDGTHVSLYVDGGIEKQVAGRGSMTTSKSSLEIGNSRIGYSRGMIDDLAIFDHGLTAEEVLRLYQEGANRLLPTRYGALYVERAEKEIAGLSPSQAVQALHQRIDDYSRWIDHQPNVRHQTDRSVPADLWCLLAREMEKAGAPQSEVSDMYSRGLRGVHDQSKYFTNALIWVYNLGDRALYQSNARDLLRSSHAPLNSVFKLTHFMNSNQNWHAFELMLDVLFSEEMPGGLSKVNCVQTIKDVFEGDSWSEKFTSYCLRSYTLNDILFEKEERAINKQLSDGNYSEAMKLHADLLQQCQLPQRVTELDYNYCRSLFEFGSYRRFMKQAVLFVDSYGGTHGYLSDQISLLMAIAESKQGNTENANNMFFKVMMERPHSMSGCRASYYLGYCAMLAGTFDVALDYFEHHTDAYPASPYRQQAMMSISRIEQVVNTR